MSAEENIVIYGASSAIAQALARIYATEGSRFFLIARNGKKLKSIESDLIARGASKVSCYEADLSELQGHDAIWKQANIELGSIQKVFLCHGVLGNQSLAEKDFQTAKTEIKINFLSFVSILTPIASQMETDGAGTIAVISSVAGDRGRKSNYIYGTSKAALTAFVSGLRNRLHSSGVHVMTILPGFVDSPMTDHLNKNFLFAHPDKIASDIKSAMDKNVDVLYTPRFWRYVMFLIRHIPEFIFKRLKL